VIIVAPVVVKPDMDSNTASVKLKFSVSDKTKGIAPVKPRPTQNSTTTTKPSLSFKSLRTFLTGNQRNKPVAIIMENAVRKLCRL